MGSMLEWVQMSERQGTGKNFHFPIEWSEGGKLNSSCCVSIRMFASTTDYLKCLQMYPPAKQPTRARVVEFFVASGLLLGPRVLNCSSRTRQGTKGTFLRNLFLNTQTQSETVRPVCSYSKCKICQLCFGNKERKLSFWKAKWLQSFRSIGSDWKWNFSVLVEKLRSFRSLKWEVSLANVHFGWRWLDCLFGLLWSKTLQTAIHSRSRWNVHHGKFRAVNYERGPLR